MKLCYWTSGCASERTDYLGAQGSRLVSLSEMYSHPYLYLSIDFLDVKKYSEREAIMLALHFEAHE